MRAINSTLKYLCILCFIFTYTGKLAAQNIPVSDPKWLEELGCDFIDPNTGKFIHVDRYGQIELTYNGVTYLCDCYNHCRPVTNESSSSTSYSSSSYKPYSSQDFKTQMITTIADYAITSFFNWLTAPSQPSKSEQQRQQQQQQIQQQKIADEKAKKEAIERWQQMQSDEDLKRKEEQAAKVKKGEMLLQQIQLFGMGSSNTAPFEMGDPREDLTPISQTTYPNNKRDYMERLMCASYFSGLANQSNKDVEAAFYNEQVQLVMSGQPTYVECKLPAATADAAMTKKIEETKQILTAFNEKVSELETLEKEEVQLTEKIKDTKDKKQIRKKELDVIKEEAIMAAPEKKDEMDELIRLAQQQLEEAEASAAEAETKQKELLDKKEKVVGELKEYNSKIKNPVQPENKDTK